MKKILVLFLVITFALALGGCKHPAKDKALVVGYDPFSGKFSPFFATTAYDQDVVSMTSLSLMTTDRDGGIVYNAIEGEDIARGASTFHYSGIADLAVNYDSGDNKTIYTIRLKNDVKFSDGHVMDADDIIFTYYVLLDPNYTGSSTLSSVDIVGYKNYKYNTSLADQADVLQKQLLSALGTDAADATLTTYVEGQIEELLSSEFDWVKADVVTDDSWAGYWRTTDGTVYDSSTDALTDVSAAATFAGFYALTDGYTVGSKSDATVLSDVVGQYGVDYATLDSNYGDSVVTPLVTQKAFEMALAATKVSEGTQGDPVPNISGIKKINQYEVQVITTGFDAAAIYQVCGITVAPMHYYGDTALYDYANNKFGFNQRTDTSMDLISTHTDKPMGAGAYTLDKYENNVVYFKSNPNYYKGEPKIKFINFQVVTEANKITSIVNGDIDVSNPSGSKTKFDQLATYSDSIYVSSIDNLGYGYIGINAKNVSVGGNAGSDASKALRTAFATVLASQRYTAVNSYYGQAANVINYSMSNTSWAAPKVGDAGYKVAFSTTPTGSTAYTADPATLTNDARTAQAKLAAKAWLVEAGYTLTATSDTAQFGDHVYTAVAPTGAKTSYEVIIPAGGNGDHPSFSIVTQFKNIMAELGITININDPADSNELWDALDAGTEELWCAAWGTTIDPDMYQIYYSTNVVKALGGGDNSTGSNHYFIQDPTLDQKIMAARQSEDQNVRKALYKDCLDIILEWAVEVPIYQRQNIIAISSERIKIDTLTPEITTYWGWMNDIEKLELK